MTQNAKYHLDKNGRFVIENYNAAKPFTNFFPGVAGIHGIPMWVFFVNRGQGISSFGIESKDKAILEFHPANKAYRFTTTQGFRTFLKIKINKKTIYWEPFQDNLPGTAFKKTQKMRISAHDLIIEETNFDLGLKTEVRYFPLPEEPFAALVRSLRIENLKKTNCEIELVDGLPAIVPYGVTDWMAKHMCRTIEAWMKVRNFKNKAPYFQLNVEVHDRPEVRHIKEGNFYFSFINQPDNPKMLDPIVEPVFVFGQATDFSAPLGFLDKKFKYNSNQQTSNRTPCAMSHALASVKGKSALEIVSACGFSHSIEQLNSMTRLIAKTNYVNDKARRNEAIITGIRDYALTKSSSDSFDQYASYTFLDNILRGGLPITLKTPEGPIVLNVFSRKHGDPERDYNFFVLTPTFYSQGNGNYRDVNQNRRNDVWFNPLVKDSHIISFMNLVQADGYNPLIVKGTTFVVDHHERIDKIISSNATGKDVELLKKYLKHPFLPGDLLKFLTCHDLNLKISTDEFLSQVLAGCHKQEIADHGEGFWTDHWTYNLDLIESYFSLYPEKERQLLLEKKVFSFYLNSHYILPRDQRYVLTDKGVRQYHSVFDASKEITAEDRGRKLRVRNGEGAVYVTTLTVKLLCLIANKAASLDPSGIGIEMEADKPGWCDALNGLPGLLGSSISETLELTRFSQFLLTSLSGVEDHVKIPVFSELGQFIRELSALLSLDNDSLEYWNKSNDIRELYLYRIRHGIEGEEVSLALSEVLDFLKLVIGKTEKAGELAKDSQGFLRTYFYHEVTEFQRLDKFKHDKAYVRPLDFKRHSLPLSLEGYVHALRIEEDKGRALKLYSQVRKSDLYDAKLKMYKVNANLSNESEEIGRARIFPRGWLENESIWLHMEYKFVLELLRVGLFDEFFENFKSVLIPFFNPKIYGRSVFENSSFLVSSAHEDKTLHGQGFVARLSGSTAEFIHMWLLMNIGPKPFQSTIKGELNLKFQPALPGWLFTQKATSVNHAGGKIPLPRGSYAFHLFKETLVIYHNPRRKDTFGSKRVNIKRIEVVTAGKRAVIHSSVIPSEYAKAIRNQEVEQIDVYLQ